MSFSDVSGASKYFVTPNEGFSTTTSGTTASGATTVGLNSVSGLTNGTTFVGVIEPAGTKEQIFTGVVDTSGSQITGVVWTKGSNIEHATGVSVVDYDTGTALKLMTTGIKKEHNDSGTHGAVTATSVTATGALTGTSLVNATHTHANAAGGGTLQTSILSNPYKFSVYHNTTQSLTTGAIVGFNTELFDTGNNYDGTNKFTAPIAGFYQFNVGLYIQATGSAFGFMSIQITKNGSASVISNHNQTPSAATNDYALVGSSLVQLAASDYIQIVLSHTKGSALTLFGQAGQLHTYFSGFLISAT